MGKTELALAYAHAFAWDYPGGRWLARCEGLDNFDFVLRQLAEPLQVPFTEEEQKDAHRAAERILAELRRRDRSLLLLDNVTHYELLSPDVLMRLPPPGHIHLLATTRLGPAQVTGSPHDHTFVAVDELPADDALALIRAHQPNERFTNAGDEAAALELVELLDGFTLAVETAAIYLGRHPAADAISSYTERLRRDVLAESERSAADHAVAVRHKEKLLERTLAFTFETLNVEQIHAITIAAVLPADQIALPWLRYGISRKFSRFASDFAAANDAAWKGLADSLLSLRFLQSGNDMRVVRMHRLVQEIVRNRTKERGEAQRSSIMPAIKEACSTAFYLHTNPDHRWLVPVIEATADAWLGRVEHGEAALALDAVFVSNAASSSLMDNAAWGRAENLLRRALSVVESTPQFSTQEASATRSNLASLLHYTNRLAEAEPLMRQVAACFEQYHDPHDPAGAAPLNNLAALLEVTNRLPEAEDLYRRALEMDKKNLGPEHPIIAVRLNNLALLLRSTGRASEAETLIRQAIAIDEQVFGTEHPTYARHLCNLSTVLQEDNRLREAEPLLTRAISIIEHTLGEESPELANALNNLGMLLRDTKRLSEAEPLIRRALAMQEKTLGLEHPRLGPMLTSLASLFQETGRLPDAEGLLRRALAIDEKSLGAAHPSVALDLKNLGAMLYLAGRPTDAIPLLSRALEIDVRNLGPEHPSHRLLLHTLIKLHQEAGSPGEAANHFRQLIALEEKSGSEQADLAALHNNFASLLKSTNRLSEAEHHYRSSLAILEGCLQPDDPQLPTALNNLAVLLEAMNRFDEAKPLYHRMLVVFARKTARTGQQPASLKIALENYYFLLQKCGLKNQEAIGILEAACAEGGWPIKLKWNPN